jgi:DNA modification methylase
MDIREIAIDELKPWGKNPRKHDIEKLVKSIERFGFRAPLVVNKRNDEYVVEAGHGRLIAAKAAGLKKLPCVVVEDDDMTAEAYAVADNRLQELASWDENALADLLKDFDKELLDCVGYSNGELDKLLKDLDAEASRNKQEDFDVEQRMESARESTTDIKPGDIFQLGSHRLMCGDSTSKDNVAKLMAGEKANLVFTDPPYNVDYKSKGGNSYSEGKYGGLKQFEDDKTLSGYHYFLTAVVQNIYDFTAAKIPVYFWYANTYADLVLSTFRKFGYSIKPSIIWLKDNLVFSYCTYHKCYEPCAYLWKDGKRPYENKKVTAKETDVWMAPDKLTFMDYLDVWYIPRDKINEYKHPTQKPTALAERAVRNSSQENDIVLDLFGGSGSTLIACEKMARQCRMMELDPHYCQVIVDRWEAFTSCKVVKTDGQRT